MRRKEILDKIYIALLFVVILTQYNNCDVYSDNSTLNSEFATSCVNQEDKVEICEYGDSTMLELKINTPDSLPVSKGTSLVDIAGDCNEAGFPENFISWDVFTLSSSSSLLVDRSSALFKNNYSYSYCKNGRFTARINLALIRDANVYTLADGLKQKIEVRIELNGMRDNGDIVDNSIMARKKIYLAVP